MTPEQWITYIRNSARVMGWDEFQHAMRQVMNLPSKYTISELRKIWNEEHGGN